MEGFTMTNTPTTFTLISPTGVGKKSVEFSTNGEAHQWLAHEKRTSRAALAELIEIIYRCEGAGERLLSGVSPRGVWTLQEGSRMVGILNARGIWNALIAAGWKVQS
jgi:hypothetical protein